MSLRDRSCRKVKTTCFPSLWWREVHIRAFANIGRDMAPFVVEFKDIYHNYDLVCWVHSKKTPYSTFSLGDEWRKYLLDNILGSTEMVDKIINDFETTPDLGLVFSDHFPLLFHPLAGNLIMKRH